MIRVAHVTDTLDVGGAERVALEIARALPKDRYRAYLCATRWVGAMAEEVPDDVHLSVYHRRHTADPIAIIKFARFLRRERIDIIHAHASSLFFAVVCNQLARRSTVVWHDHYGDNTPRPVLPYKTAARGVGSIIAVNEQLATWARTELAVPGDRVHYIPNFVRPLTEAPATVDLPGAKGRRIVCIANMRPQKDHFLLVEAMRRVVQTVPDAHALIVGSQIDESYTAAVMALIASSGLSENISVLGRRMDVASILASSDIGVLSSRMEGLPLAILEYARAGLAVVSTDVGQSASVLDDGRVGKLVPPGDADALAAGLVEALLDPAFRERQGGLLREHVDSVYGAAGIMARIEALYRGIV